MGTILTIIGCIMAIALFIETVLDGPFTGKHDEL